ncbi:MAG TPA: hypothetical protein VK895_01645, partial [Jiangellaceae bacterium]|nr:hypothetical protein [Jiangellaceae bacterium]
MPRHHASRRRFLQSIAAGVAVAPWLKSGSVYARLANEQVHIACIGVGGKGESDLAETSVGHNIVALC